MNEVTKDYTFLNEPTPIGEQVWDKDILPFVSIKCLAYNHEKFIRDAIEGFLIQKTTFPVEIWIHDDASTDKTAEIIKEYASKYPKLFVPTYQIENQYMKNPKTAKFIKPPKRRGKYIAECEGDDYWTDPYKLQKQVDFLEKNADYVVTYHNAKVVDEAGNILKESRLDKAWKKDYSEHELKIYRPILTLTMCYRNVIDYNYFVHKCSSGDSYLTSVLGNHGLGKYISNIKDAIHRKHSGGVWTSKTDQEKIVSKLELNLALSYLYTDLGDNFYSVFFMERASNHLKKIIYNNYLYKNIDLISFFVKVLDRLRGRKYSDLELSRIIDYRNLIDLKYYLEAKEYTKILFLLKIFNYFDYFKSNKTISILEKTNSLIYKFIENQRNNEGFNYDIATVNKELQIQDLVLESMDIIESEHFELVESFKIKKNNQYIFFNSLNSLFMLQDNLGNYRTERILNKNKFERSNLFFPMGYLVISLSSGVNNGIIMIHPTKKKVIKLVKGSGSVKRIISEINAYKLFAASKKTKIPKIYLYKVEKDQAFKVEEYQSNCNPVSSKELYTFSKKELWPFLKDFYFKSKIEKVSCNDYFFHIQKIAKKKKISSSILKNIYDSYYLFHKSDFSMFVANRHGDLTISHIHRDEHDWRLIDWGNSDLRVNLLTDWMNFELGFNMQKYIKESLLRIIVSSRDISDLDDKLTLDWLSPFKCFYEDIKNFSFRSFKVSLIIALFELLVRKSWFKDLHNAFEFNNYCEKDKIFML